jgi:hypothetical protein
VKHYIWFFVFSLTSFFLHSENTESFLESFVNHYDFRAEGRFTHEYHPFLLKSTIKSLYDLSDRLQNESFNLCGHVIISGYEANAIPSYYTDFRKSKINDEMSSKSKEGWSLRLHNRFGLMTGYLFKDFNRYARCWFKDDDSNFFHINPDEIELFRDETGIFQRHAFGQAYDFMNEAKDCLAGQFKQRDMNGMLSTLIKFWEKLHRSEVTLTGNLSAATQDILFSIEYAKYLKRSPLPILNFYTGGDITYPIETSVKQEQEATESAQAFAKYFPSTLKAVDDKKTAYVFCSFVDGVGKSTMLGNIKNWMKFSDDVSKYERVDNSSSQFGDIFQFNEKVYIADLPAQISHFTYKPDGLVYVDAGTELSKNEIESVLQFIKDNKKELLKGYHALEKSVLESIEKEGFFEKSLWDPERPERAFVKNLFLLKKDELNTWIPFSFEGNHYVFDYYSDNYVRVLGSLSHVASHGLKNIESEQMLFFEGIRFPLTYDVFLDDLVKKLKSENIENIVFVNFTSMYPRSCRENIRINYLIQQMALLDGEFDVDKSLYKKFVNASELYANILDRDIHASMKTSFSLEALVRYVLYDVLNRQQRTDIDGIKVEEISSLIESSSKDLVKNESFMKIHRNSIKNKFSVEIKELESRFGLTKEFVNIQQLSFNNLMHFSDILQSFFVENFEDDRLGQLWSDLDAEVVGDSDQLQGFSDKDLILDNGVDVVVRYEFPFQCKDTYYLSSFMKTLRATWYATLGNILHGDERFFVPPTLVKLCDNGQVYMVNKKLHAWQDEEPSTNRMFHLSRKVKWGEFQEKPYCLEWENEETNTEIFAFGADVVKRKYRKDSSIINKELSKYKDENGAQSVMPTSVLLKCVKESDEWNSEYSDLVSQARSNGAFVPMIEDQEDERRYGPVKVTTYLGKAENKESARILLRMLATLEMILKDPDADIVVRNGSKKDFRAALELFEKTTLPKYYGIVFEEPLFGDYKTVEPVIPWDILKN